jgi:hypothetical protein
MAKPNYYRNRYMAQMRRDEPLGRETEDEAIRRFREFDASGAVREANQAQFADIQDDLGRYLKGYRGQQVGAGRFGTGAGFTDEDEIHSRAYQDFARSASARSLDAAGLQLGATDRLYGAGRDVSNRYLDVLGGERDMEIMLENQRRERKNRLLRGLLSAGGTAVGAYFGGPVGAEAGAQAGAGVADIFG